MSLPYFKFYPKDFIGDTMVLAMSLEHQGAYLRILCAMWNYGHDRCAIPDDDEDVAAIIGVSIERLIELKPKLYRAFTVEDGWITNQRLGKEWYEAKNRSEKASQSVSKRKSRPVKGKKAQTDDQSNDSSNDQSSDNLTRSRLNVSLLTPLPPPEVDRIVERANFYTQGRYGDEIVRDYWRFINERNPAFGVSLETVKHTLTAWNKYPKDMVLEALRIHVSEQPDKTAIPNYALAIMQKMQERGWTPDGAGHSGGDSAGGQGAYRGRNGRAETRNGAVDDRYAFGLMRDAPAPSGDA